jgi:hypothetical protein
MIWDEAFNESLLIEQFTIESFEKSREHKEKKLNLEVVVARRAKLNSAIGLAPTTIIMFNRLFTISFNRRQLASVCVVCALFISLNAISQANVPGSDSDSVSNENLHGLMIERINTLKTSIDQLLYQQNRTQSQIEGARRTGVGDIAATAIALRDSVEELIMIEPGLNISPASRPIFLELARRLRDDSQALADLALGSLVGNLDEAVVKLQNNCESCHALYRN